MNHRHIIVASHQRSGTHLTIDTLLHNLQRLAGEPQLRPIVLDRLSSHSGKTEPSLECVQARSRTGPCLFKSHAHANVSDFFIGGEALSSYVSQLFGSAKIIYVFRDGRDVMVSLYHYTRMSNERVARGDFGSFLRMINETDAATYEGAMTRPAYWSYHVRSWIEQPNVLPVAFEDLLVRPTAVLERVSEFTGSSLVSSPVSMRRYRSGAGWLVEKLRRRLPLHRLGGKRFTSVAFRNGQAGDWERYFSEEDSSFFQAESQGINDVLTSYRIGSST